MGRIGVTDEELKGAWRRAHATGQNTTDGDPLADDVLDDLAALAAASGDDDVRLARLDAVLRDPAQRDAFLWFVAARRAAEEASDGLGVAAPAVAAPAISASTAPPPTGAARRGWWSLAAAAVLVITAGTWWTTRDGAPGAPIMRGTAPAAARFDGDTLRWPSVPGAERYVAEWLSGAGDLLRADTIARAPLVITTDRRAVDGVPVTHVLVVGLRGTERLPDAHLVPLSAR